MKKMHALPGLLMLLFLTPVGALTGQGIEYTVTNPIFKVSPDTGEFHGIQLGSAGTLAFTITNPGTSVLKIKKIEISGTDFTLTDDNTYPFEVVADTGFAYSEGSSGTFLKFFVSFIPPDTDLKTGKVIITYGLYSDEIHEIPLSGGGLSCLEAAVAVKGENRAPRLDIWYKYTADKFSIVEINSCHEGQVNTSSMYRLLYFYVYDGCGGSYISEIDEWTGNCPYDQTAIPVRLMMKPGQTIYIFWPLVDPGSRLAKDGFWFNILATYPIDGDVCDNAIPLTLPVVNLFGSTQGLNKDYSQSPCSPFNNYFGGKDIVYTITVNEGYLIGDIIGAYGSIHVLDACPREELAKYQCKAFAGGPTGGHFRKKIETGTYYVIISNWSPPTSIDYLLNLAWESVSSVENNDLADELKVYPNPANDRFTIEFTGEAPAGLTLELANMSGQVVYRRETKALNHDIVEIDAGQFARGVYYLRVHNAKSLKINKIILK